MIQLHGKIMPVITLKAVIAEKLQLLGKINITALNRNGMYGKPLKMCPVWDACFFTEPKTASLNVTEINETIDRTILKDSDGYILRDSENYILTV